MRQLIRPVTSVAAIALATTIGAPSALADGPAIVAGSHIVPFSTIFRRCDFSNDTYVSGGGTGSGSATITASRSTVTADVSLIVAAPDTRYLVRLIEVPRSAANTCFPGDPGVAGGVIDTDDGGNGFVSISEAVMPGATGAWVLLQGPPDGNAKQLNGDFYSSDAISPL